MLTVRSPQMEAFTAVHRRRLEDELVAHVRAHLPAHHAALGEEGTRAAAGASLDRAASLGFVTEVGLVAFARLSFVFGAEFDRTQPWAGAVLRDPAVTGEAERIRRLGQAAEAYLKRLAEG